MDMRVRVDGGERAKLTLKSGNWHNGESREEYELHFDPKEIKGAVGMIQALGHDYFVIVYIERTVFDYEDYEVTLDKFYFSEDYVLEIEKQTQVPEEGIEKEENKIKKILSDLNVSEPSEDLMVEFIQKLNFIKECQVDFTKTTINEWYDKWEEFIFCRA